MELEREGGLAFMRTAAMLKSKAGDANQFFA
jgi:hypothetical protein